MKFENGKLIFSSPSALGIGAASFASGTGNGIRERGIGIGEREFGSGEKLSEQRYSGKPDGGAETEPERPRKLEVENGKLTFSF